MDLRPYVPKRRTGSLDVATDLSEFAKMREAWDSLHERAGGTNPFTTHRWLTAWAESFARDRLLAVFERDRTGAAIRAGFFVRDGARVALPEDDHCPISGIVSLPRDAEPLSSLLEALRREGVGEVHLHTLEEADALRMRMAGSFDWVAVEVEGSPTHVMDAFPTADAYFETRSSQVRRELQRKQRKFAREAPACEFIRFSEESEQEEFWPLTLKIEEDTWKHEEGTSFVADRAAGDFYRRVYERYAPANEARGFVLGSRSEPIAYVFGILHQGTYFALKTSYRAKYSSLSPGQVIFAYLIEHVCVPNSEIQHVELLGRDARWKRELASSTRVLSDLRFTRRTVRTMAFAAARTYVKPKLEPYLPQIRKIVDKLR